MQKHSSKKCLVKFSNHFALFISIFLCVSFLTSCAQEILVPSDPMFSKENFTFAKYERYLATHKPVYLSHCGDYFNEMFPIGTDREIVDMALVKSGGAIVTEKPNNVYQYTYVSPPRDIQRVSHIFVTYDQTHKVAGVSCIEGLKGP